MDPGVLLSEIPIAMLKGVIAHISTSRHAIPPAVKPSMLKLHLPLVRPKHPASAGHVHRVTALLADFHPLRVPLTHFEPAGKVHWRPSTSGLDSRCASQVA